MKNLLVAVTLLIGSEAALAQKVYNGWKFKCATLQKALEDNSYIVIRERSLLIPFRNYVQKKDSCASYEYERTFYTKTLDKKSCEIGIVCVDPYVSSDSGSDNTDYGGGGYWQDTDYGSGYSGGGSSSGGSRYDPPSPGTRGDSYNPPSPGTRGPGYNPPR